MNKLISLILILIGVYSVSSQGTIEYRCPNNCSNNGFCNVPSGQCTCAEGYFGFDCSRINTGGSSVHVKPNDSECPNNCNNDGICYEGICIFPPQLTKINCKFTNYTVLVSSYSNITCTITGYGNCIDLIGQSQCKSNGGYLWSSGGTTECSVFQKRERNSISCTGSKITCKSGFVVCSNDNGIHYVNGDILDNETNLFEFSQENSDSEKSSSSNLSIISNFLFIILSINALL
ncbi:hypothetical protein ACTA71_012547 [Dictyostelium dimigraforme]